MSTGAGSLRSRIWSSLGVCSSGGRPCEGSGGAKPEVESEQRAEQQARTWCTSRSCSQSTTSGAACQETVNLENMTAEATPGERGHCDDCRSRDIDQQSFSTCPICT
eukprot:2242399-Rhodomonas_salina.1